MVTEAFLLSLLFLLFRAASCFLLLLLLFAQAISSSWWLSYEAFCWELGFVSFQPCFINSYSYYHFYHER